MIKRFLLLNGLATIGVVLNHAAGWGYTALFWWTDKYMPGTAVPDFSQLGSPAYYGLRAIEQLIAFAIPTFLVVSGFFMAFAAKRQATVSWRTVKIRVWYLFIPYLLWSAVIFLLEVLQGDSGDLGQYLRRLLTGSVTDGYYYVPMIIQMFFLSPLLVRLARWNWRLLLVGTAALLIFVQILLYLNDTGTAVPQPLLFWTQSWLFPGNLFWFALGVVVGFNLHPCKTWLNQHRRLWLVTAVILFPLCLIEWEIVQRLSGQPFLPTRLTLLDSIYAAVFIFALLAFENANPPRAQQISDLGPKSYGVYLTNTLALEVTARSIAVFLPVILAAQILFQPILWAAGLGIPLLLMAAVSYPKSPVRTYYQYIFG
jgi:membrane-bound acyltransferase YfiQ involved in biofilm formation